jgi:hypothetical protein
MDAVCCLVVPSPALSSLVMDDDALNRYSLTLEPAPWWLVSSAVDVGEVNGALIFEIQLRNLELIEPEPTACESD